MPASMSWPWPRALGLEQAAQIQPVHAAGHHHVQQQQVRAQAAHGLPALVGVGRLVDFVVLELQGHADQLADVRMVFDDQDAQAHDA